MRRALLLGWLALLAVGCAGRPAAPDATATVAGQPNATIPVVEGQPPAATPAASSPAAPLSGPTIAFYLEDSYTDVYLALFDPAGGVFRDLFSTVGVTFGAADWFDGGCGLTIDGRLYDLAGNLIWQPPAEAVASVDLAGARLSPDHFWLATLVRPGQTTAAGTEWLDVELIRMAVPFDRQRLTARGGGYPAALRWSHEGALLFTDYDKAGVLQVYRAMPGELAEALTAHTEPIGLINALGPSPDGRRLAYGARNLLTSAQPYALDPADEGWIGILDRDDGSSTRVQPPAFGMAESGRGLVWDAAGERLLVIGDSLPIPHDDPLYGRHVYWLAADGTIERSFLQAAAPSAQLGWVSPLATIDALMVSSGGDYYRYEAAPGASEGTLRRLDGSAVPPLGTELGRRPVGVLPAVTGFGGELTCAP